MKKKFLVPLMGVVVLGLGAYVGYHTYDAYEGTNESDLLLANAEALATGENGSYTTWSCDASSYVPCFLNVNIVELRFLERGKVMAAMVVEIDNYYVRGFLSQF